MTSLSRRRRLARDLAVAVESAGRPMRSSSFPVSLEAAGPAREELQRVVVTLSSPEPVQEEGVVKARELLTDGGGPLYAKGDDAHLVEVAHATLEALRP